MDFKDGVQFDPGFVQYMAAFVPNIEYAYASLEQYRNFNQKKMQFRMYYPKIQSLLKNYLGFYSGCILWAIYIKQFDKKQLLNNLCFGGEFDETETLSEVGFILQYLEQLKKDAKYYLGQNFEVDEMTIKIINSYREFLKENKGFVQTETTTDIVIPSNLKQLSAEDLEIVLQEIEKVVDSGRLYDLVPLMDKVV